MLQTLTTKLLCLTATASLTLLSGCESSQKVSRANADSKLNPHFLESRLTTTAAPGLPELRAQIWQPAEVPSLPKKLPLIVFLHGRGESGTDGLKQTTVGLGPWAKKNPAWFPAVILMPQKPDQQTLWPEYQTQVIAMIDTLVTSQDVLYEGRQIDPDRIILTGLSQGGHGTWNLLKSRPDLFAAAAPVCGWGTDRTYSGGQGFGALGSVPIWAFHGEKDDVVPPDSSRGLVDAVRSARSQAGAAASDQTVKLTIFPQANHNSWDPAYGDKALADWMMLQVRQR